MKVLDYMRSNILVLDGGMGTLLQAQGLQPGEHPERWNLTHPEVVQAIHKAYYDAGSNVVSSNTFGANPLQFDRQELEELIRAALDNARKAREESASPKEKFIALDVGPTGRLLKPYGDLDFEDAVAAFSEVVRLGVKYGAELVLIETMNDSYETKAALLAAKESCDLPVFVSNAYGEDGKLMTGASPEAMCAMLEGMGADAVGANCSLGPKQLRGVMERLLARASVPVLFQPNAGLPRSVNGKTVYDVEAPEFCEEVCALVDQGVRIVGGCCGTTPEYIRLLCEMLRDKKPVPIEEKEISCVSSYTHALDFSVQPILIGERINPTGKKRLQQALKSRDISYILSEGLRQQESGAHILDVNVGLPEIEEKALLPEIVAELQAVCDLPLQIDTSDPQAMEAALRRYNGKALINSVNGKKESMDAVFPLVRKYGGMVAALTLDENGIPATAEGRLEIARRILDTAAQYGIGKKDLIFDPLAMTVSAQPDAALETLKALRLIRHILGCPALLGVSNISFGLPDRPALNASFYLSALENGLSAAILNPDSQEMRRAYFTFRALHGLDADFSDYIAFSASDVRTAAVPRPERQAAKTEKEAASALQEAVMRGMKEQAAALTDELLAEKDGLSVISEEIIPALDAVGCGFERKTIYLPQLLMSAEAAKAAFSRIRARMSGSESGEKCAFVLATVEGDIHDIGKNIVRLLLENYGFAVTDLGKDVPPQIFADKVVELHAPLAGLSALMTTTVPAMEETIRLLRKQAPWCRIVVGGAVLTQEYADAIGADKYAKDAMETVRYAQMIYESL